MPRVARRVLPGFPHHITRRGTDRRTVFHSLSDRRVYVEFLKENSRKTGVGISAYSLRRNHMDLVAVPEDEGSVAMCLRRRHGRYFQFFNARRLRSGHLRQNRSWSRVMDGGHLWSASRYVERNPPRAGLVEDVKDYRWPGTTAHLSGKDTSHVLDMWFWEKAGGPEHWASLLEVREEEAANNPLRRATYAANPLGSREFVEKAKRLLADPGSRLLDRKVPRGEGGSALSSAIGIWGSGASR